MYYSETMNTIANINKAATPIRNVTRQVMSLLYIVASLFNEIFVCSVSEFLTRYPYSDVKPWYT